MKTCLLILLLATAALAAPSVATLRVPENGIQPQVITQNGIVHLIYFTGDPAHGNLNYVKSRDYGTTFSKPLRINSAPGTATAIGNIRGAQFALGKNGRIHVAWNGSTTPKTPMLYTRLNDAGTAFEPQRNLIHTAYGVDGGGTIAADTQGNIYVFWHAPAVGQQGEDHRRIWISKSTDDGKTFAPGARRPSTNPPESAVAAA